MQPASGERPSGPRPRSRHLCTLDLAGSPGSLKGACPRRLVLNALAAVTTRNKTCGGVHLSSQRHAREEGEMQGRPETEHRPCNCHKVAAISQQPSAFPARLPALCRAELGRTARARAAKRRARSGRLCWPGHSARGLGIPARSPGEEAVGRASPRLSPRVACALRGHGRRSSRKPGHPHRRPRAEPPRRASTLAACPSH